MRLRSNRAGVKVANQSGEKNKGLSKSLRKNSACGNSREEAQEKNIFLVLSK